MQFRIPQLIQGGMGAAVSHWSLAWAVSRLGALGVVSGTALDEILARRLQDGDIGGHVRRALEQFPFPKMVQRILDTYFIPDGRKPDEPYQTSRKHTVEPNLEAQELCVAANFVEVFLAREGHNHPVGINFLEKIQLPHLPSLYGAMLAGVAVVIVGAGIPMEFPAAISALANHQPASYTVNVTGPKATEPVRLTLDPAVFHPSDFSLPPLVPPAFLPIVSSATLATMLIRRIQGDLAGFVVEGSTAGGHNAPPRGQMRYSADGQPVYGARDSIDLDLFRKLGLPFWLAGGYGSAERFREALAAGATGVQVGTPFALCRESGLAPHLRQALIAKALAGRAKVYTDSRASPTGFPFKVAELEGTLSDPALYAQRKRRCDLGFLREIYTTPAGTLGYRCGAEPSAAFLAKGGKPEDLKGRKCLCNALVANVGMPQILADGSNELPLVTLGDDVVNVARFCPNGQTDFSAEDVVRAILSPA